MHPKLQPSNVVILLYLPRHA